MRDEVLSPAPSGHQGLNQLSYCPEKADQIRCGFYGCPAPTDWPLLPSQAVFGSLAAWPLGVGHFTFVCKITPHCWRVLHVRSYYQRQVNVYLNDREVSSYLFKTLNELRIYDADISFQLSIVYQRWIFPIDASSCWNKKNCGENYKERIINIWIKKIPDYMNRPS